MNNQFLACFAAILILIAGCRKETTLSPAPGPDPSKPETTKPTNAPPFFNVINTLQSNMVVQRNKLLHVWGNTNVGHQVKVSVSWQADTLTAVANASGIWEAVIPVPEANNTPQTITCTRDGFDTVVLNNILIGDVWVCSGQSNMVMPVDAIAPFLGVLNYTDEIAAANYDDIRVLTVVQDYQSQPINFLSHPASWMACSPQTVGNMSAIAYFFAQKLHNTLHVPIGIIVSAVNGTYCESWTNPEAFKQNTAIKVYSGIHGSSMLYNGMISPLTKLSISGFLWYQGENNEHDAPTGYAKLNAALINGWRGTFKQDELPFYLVQMTPFAEDYNSTNPAGGNPTLDDYAKFREGQASILTMTTNTGMAVTMDVGEVANHHPRNKKPVGERLALLALKNTYHQDVICYGPKFASYQINGNTAFINYAVNTADGLNTINNQPLNQLFYVAGTDHVFRQALAQIAGDAIVVTAPAKTPLPIQAIRYAFTNAPLTNLQNAAGLPAEPFRTDNWDN